MASLIALLEAGTTPWRREWDTASGGHHVNLLSGRRYRGANPALLTLGLHLRGSALPYWCGFSEAKALGIFPRKGSKAVHVLRPQSIRGAKAGWRRRVQRLRVAKDPLAPMASRRFSLAAAGSATGPWRCSMLEILKARLWRR